MVVKTTLESTKNVLKCTFSGEDLGMLDVRERNSKSLFKLATTTESLALLECDGSRRCRFDDDQSIIWFVEMI